MTSFLDRLRGRPEPRAKAVTGAGVLAYGNDISLASANGDWQRRAAAYLAAYRIGWFYKGGARISRDFANLEWSLAYEDTEGDNEEAIVAPANNAPFDSLDPLEQFLRLSERPNERQTGRQLKQKQMIRYLFTGRAIYYLAGGDGGQLPMELYGISPARMWPSYSNGGNLVGWVMDKDAPSGGVPFTTDEIVVVEEPDADSDAAGQGAQGVVEAVYDLAGLGRAIPRHISDVLATGGRMAGMITPKERSLSEDEFQDALRAWRNVTSDPNAARRLLLFPEPMEYTAAAVSPAQIGLPELATLSRDDILTAFPINPFMVGVPLATGMNSGDTLRYVTEEYWSGTQHPRVEAFEDALQQQMLPRYEAAVGRPLDFDIVEPDLDDAPALIEKVGALKGLVSVGFDPKEAVSAVGLDQIKWNGLPDLLDPVKQAEAAAAATAALSAKPAAGDGMTVTANDTNHQDAAATVQTVAGKAITRADVLEREFPGLQATLSSFLYAQRNRIAERVAATLPPTKAERAAKANDEWWDGREEDRLLRNELRTVYLSIGKDALQVVAENTSRIIAGKRADKVLDDLLARSGLRITDINETTRKTIAATLETGVKRGYSIPQLVNGVPDEAFGGVHGALMANGVNVWDTYRAEVIARTETMTAYNEAALLGYKDVNVNRVEAIDGDHDAECQDRDGKTFTTDEALSIADHPNGTLDWVPITKSVEREDNVVWLDALKAIAERPAPVTHNHFTLPGTTVDAPITITTPEVILPAQEPTVVNVTMPEQAAPVVNVTNIPPSVEVAAPSVHMDAPVVHVAAAEAPVVNITNIPPSVEVATVDVHVAMPEQPAPVVNVEAKAADVIVNVPEQKAPVVNMPATLEITGMPDRVIRSVVKRDAKGAITETTQVETDG